MIAYIFPGQGSQTVGMGQDLFHHYKDFITKADEILGYSIEKLCLEDPNNQLNKTEYTQPALYVVNTMMAFSKLKESGQIPHYLAGHSLGEYNALFFGGAFDFETGLKMVKKRGELMSKAKDGGMAAIIGLTEEQIRDVIAKNDLPNISIANLNSLTQVVITGSKSDIEKSPDIFQNAGASMVIPLKVSGAFHSPLMEEAKKEYEAYIQQFKIETPKIPVVANVTGELYPKENIHSFLANQITNSVQWVKIIQFLTKQGVTQFIETGPGNVLSGLVKRIQNNK